MATRIVRPDTAFPLDAGKRKRTPRVHNETHLRFIRNLPCVAQPSWPGPCEAAHVRYGDLKYGKRMSGVGEKPDDRWTVPLCTQHHWEQHSMGERVFWKLYGIDPLRVATALFACSGDEEAGKEIVRGARG